MYFGVRRHSGGHKQQLESIAGTHFPIPRESLSPRTPSLPMSDEQNVSFRTNMNPENEQLVNRELLEGRELDDFSKQWSQKDQPWLIESLSQGKMDTVIWKTISFVRRYKVLMLSMNGSLNIFPKVRNASWQCAIVLDESAFMFPIPYLTKTNQRDMGLNFVEVYKSIQL